MLMTDQDQDGSHIKGLIINFIHHFWPELLKLNFIQEFITPIIKVRNGQITISFYNLLDFEKWKKEIKNIDKYSVKYYKGLGTSTSDEAKEYFKDIIKHQFCFVFEKGDSEEILKAFSKKHIDQRKIWLNKFMEENKLFSHEDAILYNRNNKSKSITYSDFINKELVHFSNTDNIRSIPNMMDGLKPGQRKIMYVCFKMLKDQKEIKVEQLSGLVSSKSSYHHGEQSLKLSIINIAHNYIGSNNINLLDPKGQFGTRLMGGKDAANPRYIFTKLSSITKYIFKKEDEDILNYKYEENQKIEPDYYIPVIPMILVNGARGIGTGWSTNIPCFNPIDIIKEMKLILNKNMSKEKIFKPWYRNFKGSILNTENEYIYISIGVLYVNNLKKEILITELPIGVWTQVFKEKIIEDKNIKEYKEYNTDTNVCFLITLNKDKFDELYDIKNGFMIYFNLINTIRTSNLIAFDGNFNLKSYNSPNKIIYEFYKTRIQYYYKRKTYLVNKKTEYVTIINNQARFIQEKCNNEIYIENRTYEDITKMLVSRNYTPDPRNKNVIDFDYLIDLPIRSLTKQKIQELKLKQEKEETELRVLENTSIEETWNNELDELLEKYKEFEKINNNNNYDIPVNLINFENIKYLV